MQMLLLLALLTVTECDDSNVVGQTGQNVTLTCKYDIKHGASHVCWGRGDIPLNGCSNKLISTDGHQVTGSASSRYLLLGQLDEGDVSLTILNLTVEDSGRYGCRVEIPGWFNDKKHILNLTVIKAPTSSTSPTSETSTETFTEMSTETSTADQTAGLVVTTSLTSPHRPDEDDDKLIPVLLCVLFLLVVLVTAGGLFFMCRRWPKTRPSQQKVQGSTSSTLQLHHRGSTIENIYQVDGTEDTGDYEFCP